jgi:hypothetical protein
MLLRLIPKERNTNQLKSAATALNESTITVQHWKRSSLHLLPSLLPAACLLIKNTPLISFSLLNNIGF